MWKQKVKKIAAILIIILLLPYILTVFIRGAETTEAESELDRYCVGVLAREVSEDYEDEMLKTQAILVRTTIYKEVQENEGKLNMEETYDVRAEISGTWYQKLREIWKETKGQVLLYEDKLALTPFHNLSNGKTRNGKEVLGSDDYPYLKSVDCPKDVESEKQIDSKLINAKSVKIVSTDSAGYVTEVQMGKEKVSGDQFRDTYKLPSSCFILQSAGEKTRVITSGIGHGLGLSQNTANEMAKSGKSCEEILSYFFEGTTIKEVAEVLLNVE